MGLRETETKKKQRLDGIMLIRDPLLPKVSKRIEVGLPNHRTLITESPKEYLGSPVHHRSDSGTDANVGLTQRPLSRKGTLT